MLIAAPLCALGAVAMVMASNLGMRDDRGWSLGTALFAALLSLWLLLGGIAFVRRRPVRALRAPGVIALLAGVVGIAVELPASFGNSARSESVWMSLMLLPVVFAALAGAVGHLRLSAGRKGTAGFHWLAFIAFIGGPLVLVVLFVVHPK